jgi:hypothetical protein
VGAKPSDLKPGTEGLGTCARRPAHRDETVTTGSSQRETKRQGPLKLQIHADRSLEGGDPKMCYARLARVSARAARPGRYQPTWGGSLLAFPAPNDRRSRPVSTHIAAPALA